MPRDEVFRPAALPTWDGDEADALGILRRVLDDPAIERTALVSSFGAESVVLLHLVAQVGPALPVLFLETGMLFPETLDYQVAVAEHLGLTDVRLIGPEEGDADGTLHQRDPEACCALRKTRPLERALSGFDAWITGRKRFHGGQRVDVPVFEASGDGRLKVNPLAAWPQSAITEYIDRHDLPRHPLVAQGFTSIGCAPCTTQVAEGESPRAGRWRGLEKSECGIHLVDGRFVRRDERDAA